MAAEPGPFVTVAGPELRGLALVLGDYSDLKSPYTLGHARGVAAVATSAARGLGLDASLERIQQAALLHDIGRAGIPTGILDRPGPLSPIERERAEAHSHHTERIVESVPAWKEVARLAGRVHERLDGSGYHRGLERSAVGPEVRLLAAANAYRSSIEGRAYRKPKSPAAAARQLRKSAAAGEHDATAVEAVLSAVGVARAPSASAGLLPGGLTRREVEVLRCVARGLTNKEIAAAMTISPRTVQQHTRHIYEKLGVATRAGATLFAAENDLFMWL